MLNAAPAPPAALSGGISQKSVPESFHTSYWSSELTFAKYWAAQRGAQDMHKCIVMGWLPSVRPIKL